MSSQSQRECKCNDLININTIGEPKGSLYSWVNTFLARLVKESAEKGCEPKELGLIGAGESSSNILPECKRLLLEKMALYYKMRKENSDGDKNDPLRLAEKHLDEVAEALSSIGYKVKECRFTSIYRATFGRSSGIGYPVFEIGLAFDPLMDLPYIPASTLKGAFRSALIDVCQSRTGKNVNECKKLASRIFGSSERGEAHAGLVGVSDAYPIGFRDYLVYPDVLTPHYPGARDELEVKPKPVVHPVIAEGVTFKCYLYWRESRGKYRLGDRDIRDGGLEGLLEPDEVPYVDASVLLAFIQGVGAKTSVGYSRFALQKYGPPSS